MGSHKNEEVVNRRELLTSGASAAALLCLGEEVRAQAQTPPAAPVAPPVNCAVIGVNLQGRAILGALSRVPGANVAAICDTYANAVKRARESAPKAAAVADYRQVLDRKDITAVFIATPTHQHKEIALAAIAAGKNVYCEAPLAHTIEDAKAIAQAAKSSGQVFQAGLQYRSNPQHLHVSKFVRSGVLDKPVQARAQWHKKGSWRRAAPTDARQNELNWRLRKATSPGLIGEIGIHSLDVMNWFLKTLPVSVTAFGSIVKWDDGRDVPDTVQCVLEYPNGFRVSYDATLGNSFDGTYELFMGTDGTVLLRGERAWMFKEVDAPLLGWEVYTRKEQIGDENGLVMVADATKILALGKIPGKDGSLLDPGKDALYYSVEAFLNNVREKKPSASGPLEGLQATVTALKANEAVMTGNKIVFQKEWFDLA